MNTAIQFQQIQQNKIPHDEPLTGEMLSLRYMWPCAEGMADKGRISHEHFSELKKLVENGGQPRRALLKFCFPNAFKGMRSTALYLHKISQLAKTAENDTRYGDGTFDPASTWTLSNVRIHWRCIHNFNHTGTCTTSELEVMDFSRDNSIVLAASTKKDHATCKVINLYGLKLWIRAIIYVHRGVIAEAQEYNE